MTMPDSSNNPGHLLPLVIKLAMKKRKMLRLKYNDKDRLVKPLVLGRTKDDELVLRVLEVNEETGHDTWKTFRIENIQGLSSTEILFDPPAQPMTTGFTKIVFVTQ